MGICTQSRFGWLIIPEILGGIKPRMTLEGNWSNLEYPEFCFTPEILGWINLEFSHTKFTYVNFQSWREHLTPSMKSTDKQFNDFMFSMDICVPIVITTTVI